MILVHLNHPVRKGVAGHRVGLCCQGLAPLAPGGFCQAGQAVGRAPHAVDGVADEHAHEHPGRVEALILSGVVAWTWPVGRCAGRWIWIRVSSGARCAYRRVRAGAELADQLGVPLLAQLPLVPELRAGGDVGEPIAVQTGTEAGGAFADLAETVDVELAPKRRYRSELKIV